MPDYRETVSRALVHPKHQLLPLRHTHAILCRVTIDLLCFSLPLVFMTLTIANCARAGAGVTAGREQRSGASRVLLAARSTLVGLCYIRAYQIAAFAYFWMLNAALALITVPLLLFAVRATRGFDESQSRGPGQSIAVRAKRVKAAAILVLWCMAWYPVLRDHIVGAIAAF